jgi:hypothetical protein
VVTERGDDRGQGDHDADDVDGRFATSRRSRWGSKHVAIVTDCRHTVIRRLTRRQRRSDDRAFVLSADPASPPALPTLVE